MPRPRQAATGHVQVTGPLPAGAGVATQPQRSQAPSTEEAKPARIGVRAHYMTRAEGAELPGEQGWKGQAEGRRPGGHRDAANAFSGKTATMVPIFQVSKRDRKLGIRDLTDCTAQTGRGLASQSPPPALPFATLQPLRCPQPARGSRASSWFPALHRHSRAAARDHQSPGHYTGAVHAGGHVSV